MKVLFVYHNEIEESFMPYSIAVLGGVAKKCKVETKLFDTSFLKDINSKVIENDRQVRERTGEYKKVEGYNPERKIVNLKEMFMQTVEEYKPDLIAATSTSYEFDSLIEMIYPAKIRFNIPLIVGGAHPTVAPDQAINKKGVDMICIGEGEYAFESLLNKIKQNQDYQHILNLWVKDSKGEIIRNNLGDLIDMDDIPEPDWDLIDSRHRIRPFEGELMNYGFFEISRGCPNTCSYCINHVKNKLYKESGVNSKIFRFHSPKEIVKRMVKYKLKYGFNHIHLIDDNLSVMPIEKLEELSKLYKDNVGIKFFTMGRPEPLVANPQKVKVLAEMGCEMIALGAESGNEELRRTVLKRPMDEDILKKAVEIIKNQGIKVSLFNIIGFPTETKEMIFETIELNRRIKPDSYSVRFLHPYPGTAIRDFCIERQYITGDFEKEKRASFLMEPILNLPSPPHPTKQELIDLKQNFGRYVKMSDKEYEEIKAKELNKKYS